MTARAKLLARGGCSAAGVNTTVTLGIATGDRVVTCSTTKEGSRAKSKYDVSSDVKSAGVARVSRALTLAVAGAREGPYKTKNKVV